MKGQKKKKKCLKSRIVSFVLVGFIFFGNVSIRPAKVKAGESVSLAEYVLTLFASMGVGISDEAVLSNMSNYMNIDINSGTENIQNAISQCEARMGSNFISSTFASSANSTNEYLEIVGTENIDGVPDYTATAAENISASIDNYNNNGFVSVVEGGKKLAMSLPLVTLAKAAGETAAIAWEKFSNWAIGRFRSGLGLLEKDYAGSHNHGIGAYKWDKWNTDSSPQYFATRNIPGVLVGHYEDSRGPFIWIVNNSGGGIDLRNHFFRRNGTTGAAGGVGNGSYYKAYADGVAPNGKSVWGGIEGDPESYIGVHQEDLCSPDVIGNEGNMKPGIKPTDSHNSEKPYLVPIPLNVYLIWAQLARENTENGDTGEKQGVDFGLMVGPFFNFQVDIDGIPQGTLNNPNPVYPSQPTYIPYPTIDVLASPTPATEVIPAPTLTPQELGQELEDNTVRNLANVFPFCIPFDIVNLFKKLYVPRKAPVVTWSTDFGMYGSAGSVTIDFSMFDGVASVCRTFELILFILGLMIATKNLIGWGG